MATNHLITDECKVLNETEGGVTLELVGYGEFGEWRDGEDPYAAAKRIAGCLNACRDFPDPSVVRKIADLAIDFVECADDIDNGDFSPEDLEWMYEQVRELAKHRISNTKANS